MREKVKKKYFSNNFETAIDLGQYFSTGVNPINEI
jgi:hypothetical protein